MDAPATNVRTGVIIRTYVYAEAMKVTATQLRQNIYGLLDEALATGQAIEIERKGKVLRIVPPPGTRPAAEMTDEEFKKEYPRLARLTKWDVLVGDPDDIVHMDWSHEWSELKKPSK